MRELTAQEIEKLASKKGIRRIAVENFLMSMGTDKMTALNNLYYDAQLYHWNTATRQAILKGIDLACAEVES